MNTIKKKTTSNISFFLFIPQNSGKPCFFVFFGAPEVFVEIELLHQGHHLPKAHQACDSYQAYQASGPQGSEHPGGGGIRFGVVLDDLNEKQDFRSQHCHIKPQSCLTSTSNFFDNQNQILKLKEIISFVKYLKETYGSSKVCKNALTYANFLTLLFYCKNYAFHSSMKKMLTLIEIVVSICIWEHLVFTITKILHLETKCVSPRNQNQALK